MITGVTNYLILTLVKNWAATSETVGGIYVLSRKYLYLTLKRK